MLVPSSTKIYTFWRQIPLPLKGAMDLWVQHNSKESPAKFNAIEKESETLIGCHMAEDLGLLSFDTNVQKLKVDELIDQFPVNFKG